MGLRRLFKKAMAKRGSKYITENGVTFIHHNPSRGNIGDLLCSPRHYFNFVNPLKNLTIIGGGVFVDLAINKLKKEKLDPQKTILWGVGQSIRNINTTPPQIPSLPYLDWGTRDKNLLDTDQHFLPCVSCLHPMLSAPFTNQQQPDSTLLFLNRDPKVTSSDVINRCENIAKAKGWTLIFNDCTEDDIAKELKSHKKIITNSYHGAYWGLLSGKELILMGYSSKFVSLLSVFGFTQESLLQIKRGDPESLIQRLESLNNDSDLFIKLKNAENTLDDFRKINLNFASRLIKLKAISSFTLKKT